MAASLATGVTDDESMTRQVCKHNEPGFKVPAPQGSNWLDPASPEIAPCATA
jgi:hypothetical protein